MSTAARQARDRIETAVAERGLPANLMAERAVLGSIILDGSKLHVVESESAAEEYHSDGHRIILRAMRWLAKRGSPIDYLTLVDALTRSGDLDRVGGAAYLTSLTDGLPRDTNVQHYARIVRREWRRRQLLAIGARVSERALDPSNDVAELAREATAALVALEANNARAQYEMLADIGMARLDAMAAMRQRQESLASDLAWGDAALDQSAPVEKGDLVVIGGMSSSGKSALAVQIALANGALGRRGLVISLEMTKGQQFDRAVSMVSKVPYSRFRRPKELSDATMESLITAFADGLGSLRIGIADQPSLTVEDIATLGRQFGYKEGGLDFVIVDHAQIIEGAMRRGESRASEMSGICSGCKRLAKSLGVVVVLLSQFVKIDENREPRLSDFKESGAVYENADVVLALHRPYVFTLDHADKGKERGLLLKVRQGAADRLPLLFDEQTGHWSSRTWEDGEQAAAKSAPRSKKRWA